MEEFSLLFQNLNQLKRLNLSNNNIRVLEYNLFNNLVNLELLTLKDCKIEEIEPNTFAGLKELKKLDLRENPVNPVGQTEIDAFKEKYSLNEGLILVKDEHLYRKKISNLDIIYE
jgi:Leucine-rich repeat (LRR) protein